MSVEELLNGGKKRSVHDITYLTDEEKEVLNTFREAEVSLKEYLEGMNYYINQLEAANGDGIAQITEAEYALKEAKEKLYDAPDKPLTLNQIKKATDCSR